jgi:hypothetical protein
MKPRTRTLASAPAPAVAGEPGRRGRVALFFAAFSFFLLTGGREPPWGDARPIWEVADGLARRGEIAIATPWPPDLPRGRDGRVYAVAPLAQSLVHVPGALVRRGLGKLAPRSAPHTLALASHLAPAALGALVCVLFFGFARRQGVSAPVAALGTGALALGTTLWVYARSPYAEVLQAAAFLGFFDALLAARAGPSRRALARAALWAGLLVASKPVYALALPGAAAILAWGDRDRRRALLRGLPIVAAALAPFAAMMLLYNWARWGSIANAGYVLKPTGDVVRLSPFGETILFGLLGLFLSPGKSVFLYSPPLLLSLVAFGRAWRRWRAGLAALAATAGPVVLFYGSFLFWAGDYAWGPRYLVFLVPPLLLPACLLADDLRAAAPGRARVIARAACAVALAAGLGVQILGVAFFWDHHIRLSQEARTRWLGAANRGGAATPTRDGLCGACFEDTHHLQWLPPFQPIRGHAWLLRHVPFGHDWATAEPDAPWRGTTTLRLDLSERWRGVRLDWWFFDLRAAHGAAATALLAALALGAAACTAAFLRALRAGGRARTGA